MMLKPRFVLILTPHLFYYGSEHFGWQWLSKVKVNVLNQHKLLVMSMHFSSVCQKLLKDYKHFILSYIVSITVFEWFICPRSTLCSLYLADCISHNEMLYILCRDKYSLCIVMFAALCNPIAHIVENDHKGNNLQKTSLVVLLSYTIKLISFCFFVSHISDFC